MRLCKGKCWARVVCSINTKLVASVGEVESISPKLRACDGARHAQLSVSHTARNVALQRTQNRNVATTKNVGQRHKVSSHACGAQCRDAWPAARLPQVKHACGCRFEQGLTASGNAPVVAVAVAVGARRDFKSQNSVHMGEDIVLLTVVLTVCAQSVALTLKGSTRTPT
jgi:hypothetical protein